MTSPRILVITPVRHIVGVWDKLNAAGAVTCMEDPSLEEVLAAIGDYDAVYTNPNKSKVFIGREVMDAGRRLKAICTASTGTNHIDKEYAAKRGIAVLSLTEERKVIDRISSTAEHAFALTLAGLRHVVRSHAAVLRGEWDYTPYIGRQMDGLTIGVVGHGRLGALYTGYCLAFGARVVVYDPYKRVNREGAAQVANLGLLLRASDVIALHVHVTEETTGMIDASCFSVMKNDVLLVNTARGEVVNEADLVEFLCANPRARVATDVLADEIRKRLDSPLLQLALRSDQVIITPHVGGMTREAQEIAFGHAAERLRLFFAGAGRESPVPVLQTK